jgi:hypothetical protein
MIMDQERTAAVYEITLSSAPPPKLSTSFPAFAVHAAPAATVLSKQITDPSEVDELIKRLRSLGVTPLEVRASVGDYEFRIQGRLGRSILRYLQWGYRLEKERTVVRVAVTQHELRMILEQLAKSGIQIDRCVRRSAA